MLPKLLVSEPERGADITPLRVIVNSLARIPPSPLSIYVLFTDTLGAGTKGTLSNFTDTVIVNLYSVYPNVYKVVSPEAEEITSGITIVISPDATLISPTE